MAAGPARCGPPPADARSASVLPPAGGGRGAGQCRRRYPSAAGRPPPPTARAPPRRQAPPSPRSRSPLPAAPQPFLVRRRGGMPPGRRRPRRPPPATATAIRGLSGSALPVRRLPPRHLLPGPRCKPVSAGVPRWTSTQPAGQRGELCLHQYNAPLRGTRREARLPLRRPHGGLHLRRPVLILRYGPAPVAGPPVGAVPAIPHRRPMVWAPRWPGDRCRRRSFPGS